MYCLISAHCKAGAQRLHSLLTAHCNYCNLSSKFFLCAHSLLYCKLVIRIYNIQLCIDLFHLCQVNGLFVLCNLDNCIACWHLLYTGNDVHIIRPPLILKYNLFLSFPRKWESRGIYKNMDSCLRRNDNHVLIFLCILFMFLYLLQQPLNPLSL